MSKKRFTDIEIWDREWFMELSPKHKCLVRYMFDKCDASGCWKPNWKLASTHIGEPVEQKDLYYIPDDQYEELPNGKIFIPDFISFQYGKLSRNSPAHNPVFLAIEKNNLSDRVSDRVLHTPKEKDKDKEEEKEEDKEEKDGINFQKKSDFSMIEIYYKGWEAYRGVINGQARHLTEDTFKEWKYFVDFVYEKKFEELFTCKFINPIDFAKLLKENHFPRDKWEKVLRDILSTGIKPEHNLYHRIPKFIEYGDKFTAHGSKPNKQDAARSW